MGAAPFTTEQLVELSRSLPEVLLKESDRWTNITFKGKGFAWVNHPENRAMIKAHHDEREPCSPPGPTSTKPAGRPTRRPG